MSLSAPYQSYANEGQTLHLSIILKWGIAFNFDLLQNHALEIHLGRQQLAENVPIA